MGNVIARGLASQAKQVTDDAILYNAQNGLLTWRLAKARLEAGETEIINLNVVGDSISEGFNGSATTIAEFENGFAALLRTALATKFGSVGYGFVPNRYPYGIAIQKWSYTGTWINGAVAGWMSGTQGCMATHTNGSTATLVFNGTGITVLGEQSTGGTKFTVTIDGGAQADFVLTGASGVVKAYTVAELADGEHTIVLTSAGGAETYQNNSLLGAYEIKGTVGVRLNLFAVAGNTTVLQTAYPVNIAAPITFLTPKLTILSFLANDFNTQTTLATFKTNWQTLITAAKAQGSVLITTAGGIFNVSKAIPMSAYKKVLFDLAISNDVAFLDIAKRWGDSYALGSGYIADTAHPNWYGHKDIYTAIARTLEIV